MARTPKDDSSLTRMLRVLDLFTDQRMQWSAEEVADTLQVSLPTAYRYVKTLVGAGLLRHEPNARYALGPRIVVLDHYIRQADPVLKIGVPFMKELVAQTGFDCVISSLHGDQLLDTHREYSSLPADLSYGRGRPRPLFLGAAAKSILASLPSPQLHRLFDAHLHEVEAAGLPTLWPAFRSHYARIRREGFYFSNGELETTLAALAVPLRHADGTVLGAVSLVTSVGRMAVIDPAKLIPLLQRSATDIVARLS